MKKQILLAPFILALAFSFHVPHSVLAATDTQAAQADQSESWWKKARDILLGKPTNLPPEPSAEQERAAHLARMGKYDEALGILKHLHQTDPTNIGVTRDYIAVLSWAGWNQEAVGVYQALPPQQPDYVLAAVAHAYRQLRQTDKALATYQLGLQQSPNNVVFAAGQIRCLEDQGKLQEALAAADADIGKHGQRTEIVTARQDIAQEILNIAEQKAVAQAHAGNYTEALATLEDLHVNHPGDQNITRDYLAVLDWSNGDAGQVVNLYQSLTPGPQPDYVLAAVGHAYRRLHRYDLALAIYQKGLSQYPDSAVFMEGQIRCIADQGRKNDALAMAEQDLRDHGERPQIVAVAQSLKPPPPVQHVRGKAHSMHKKKKPSVEVFR